ncbi:MAG TPA: PDC sensor domain-containing protein, partial [Polyangiaceae bacterium]
SDPRSRELRPANPRRVIARAAGTVSAQLSGPRSFDEDRLKRALLAHTSNHPELLGACAAGDHGIGRVFVRSAGEVSLEPISYADRDYYLELVKQPRIVISKVVLGRISRTLAVQVVAPIFQDSSRFGGFTCSSLDLTKLATLAEKSVRGLPRGRIVIVNGDGKSIADSSDESGASLRDFSGVSLYRSLPSGAVEVRTGVDDGATEVRAAVIGLSAPVKAGVSSP